MLFSMTGYGRATGHFGEKTILAEVRALNSKMTDLKLRFPGDYREKEVELRKLVTDHAERGKIDVVIDIQNADGAASVSLNEALFRGYHRELSRLTSELGMGQTDLLQAILRIPNVVSAAVGEVDEEEWAVVCQTMTHALDQFITSTGLPERHILDIFAFMEVTIILRRGQHHITRHIFRAEEVAPHSPVSVAPNLLTRNPSVMLCDLFARIRDSRSRHRLEQAHRFGIDFSLALLVCERAPLQRTLTIGTAEQRRLCHRRNGESRQKGAQAQTQYSVRSKVDCIHKSSPRR